MKRYITLSIFLGLCVGLAIANSYRPRTLDEKVEDADLIVFGTATAFGPKDPAVPDKAFPLYERNIRIDVKKILWPPSFTNSSVIIFRYCILESWPKSCWDYTNTAGVFFLIKSKKPERGQWDQLERFNDWMENVANAPSVRASIKKIKKRL